MGNANSAIYAASLNVQFEQGSNRVHPNGGRMSIDFLFIVVTANLEHYFFSLAISGRSRQCVSALAISSSY